MCAMQKILQQSYNLVFSRKLYYKTFYFKILFITLIKSLALNTWINHFCNFQISMAKNHAILYTKCREIFCGINGLSRHLSNCYKEINFTYDKKCNKLNIIKDKTEDLYCLNCQNMLQINVPVKCKHSKLS